MRSDGKSFLVNEFSCILLLGSEQRGTTTKGVVSIVAEIVHVRANGNGQHGNTSIENILLPQRPIQSVQFVGDTFRPHSVSGKMLQL